MLARIEGFLMIRFRFVVLIFLLCCFYDTQQFASSNNSSSKPINPNLKTPRVISSANGITQSNYLQDTRGVHYYPYIIFTINVDWHNGLYKKDILLYKERLEGTQEQLKCDALHKKIAIIQKAYIPNDFKSYEELQGLGINDWRKYVIEIRQKVDKRIFDIDIEYYNRENKRDIELRNLRNSLPHQAKLRVQQEQIKRDAYIDPRSELYRKLEMLDRVTLQKTLLEMKELSDIKCYIAHMDYRLERSNKVMGQLWADSEEDLLVGDVEYQAKKTRPSAHITPVVGMEIAKPIVEACKENERLLINIPAFEEGINTELFPYFDKEYKKLDKKYKKS